MKATCNYLNADNISVVGRKMAVNLPFLAPFSMSDMGLAIFKKLCTKRRQKLANPKKTQMSQWLYGVGQSKIVRI